MSQEPKNQNTQTIAVLADCQNVGVIKHAEAILRFVQQQGETALLWAYHDWQTVKDTKQKHFQTLGWQCLNVCSKQKDALDKSLIRDFQRLLQSWIPDIVVLISGDRDFAPLVDEIIRLGKQVIIIGRQNYISHRLINLAPQKVYFLEDLELLNKG